MTLELQERTHRLPSAWWQAAEIRVARGLRTPVARRSRTFLPAAGGAKEGKHCKQEPSSDRDWTITPLQH